MHALQLYMIYILCYLYASYKVQDVYVFHDWKINYYYYYFEEHEEHYDTRNGIVLVHLSLICVSNLLIGIGYRKHKH